MGIKNFLKSLIKPEVRKEVVDNDVYSYPYPYPVPYSIVKVEQGINAPKIEFREVIIDTNNIMLYRKGLMPFLNGYVTSNIEDGIVIYRYKLSDKLHLDPNIEFDKVFIKEMNIPNKEEKIILHERKHWNNLHFGNQEELIKNLEELALSFAWNEISAFTEMNNYGASLLTEDKVLCSLMQATREYISKMPKYLEIHFNIVETVAMRRALLGQLKLDDFLITGNRHSESFNRLIKGYLSFGNICCWRINDNNCYAKEIKQNVSAIKYKYKEHILNLKNAMFYGR